MKGDVSACGRVGVALYLSSLTGVALRHSQHGEGKREFIGRQGSFSDFDHIGIETSTHLPQRDPVPRLAESLMAKVPVTIVDGLGNLFSIGQAIDPR